MVPTVPLHCDSQPIMKKVKNKNYNEKIRHKRIRHNSIKQLLTHGVISLNFVKSKKNIVDLLTKGFACKQVLESLKKIGLKLIKWSFQ